MENPPQLTIVIPVYNEEKVLPAVAPRIIEFCKKHNWLVVFVNDGSLDESGQLLDALKTRDTVKVLHHKVNRGYGGALKTGIQNATTPYIVTIDADGQHDPEDIEKLYAFAIQNDADMVVGCRNVHTGAGIYRAVGKWLIRRFAQLFMHLPVKDLNSGFKLYRTDLAQSYITVCPNSMSFSDVITLIFINQRNLVLEHPITIYPRRTGKSTINTYTALETVMEIMNIALMFNPLRIFLPISFLCIIVGLGWGTIIMIIAKRGVSVGAMLAIVTGLIFFVLGLLANQIAAMRMEQLSNSSSNKNELT